MNGFLIDTHVVLFALARPEKLSATARAAMEQGPVRLSTISYWEVVLKASRGKLDVGDPRLWWDVALRQLAAIPLAMKSEHIDRLADLTSAHNDPFERILAAQAIEEGPDFVSADARNERIRRGWFAGNLVIHRSWVVRRRVAMSR